jgi:hypothetical protein
MGENSFVGANLISRRSRMPQMSLHSNANKVLRDQGDVIFNVASTLETSYTKFISAIRETV